MPSLRPRRAAGFAAVATLFFVLLAVAAPLAPTAAAAATTAAAAAAPNTSKNAATAAPNESKNFAPAAPNKSKIAAPASASADKSAKKKSSPPPIPPLPTPTPYVICEDQTYALCASASAFVFQQVAYAKCEVEQGDSISAPPLTYRSGGEFQNICDMNEIGSTNGFMMSTFSLPEEVKAGGSSAIYTCPGGSEGGYAQCDGGTCFRSTQGQYFPGVGDVAPDQIICSCPIVMATTASAPFGWQFIGPYPCDQSKFAACDQDPRTGDIIPVGAPPGAGRVLTELLYGQQYALNECFSAPPP